jgi:hypothetical protein
VPCCELVVRVWWREKVRGKRALLGKLFVALSASAFAPAVNGESANTGKERLITKSPHRSRCMVIVEPVLHSTHQRRPMRCVALQ